ncbi:MAG: phage holin family protein [Solirubrobacterales bacterium]
MADGPEKTPLGDSIGDIVDRTTKIVHEEIELAKAEISVALQDLLRGSVAGIVGGVFAFFGLFILLIAFSFLVADAVGAWYPWLGFFIVAFICFIIGGLLAFVALKKIKKGSQLAPTQAIDEAKQTKSALKAEADKPVETIDSTAVEETPVPAATKPQVADVEPATPAAAAAASTEVKEAKQELADARDEADELELDAKEAKKRAKQEAKEAKEAAKAAKKAEDEAKKAEAIAAKKAEQAEKTAAKERAKAEKAAAKAAKKGNQPEAAAEAAPAADAQPQQPPAQGAQPYTPPQPPQTPPPPPNDPTGSN